MQIHVLCKGFLMDFMVIKILEMSLDELISHFNYSKRGVNFIHISLGTIKETNNS